MFLRNQHISPEAPALYDAGEWWTYSRLASEVDRWTGLLKSQTKWTGLLKSQTKKLVFCFPQSDIPSVCCYLAAIEAGHAVALLDAKMAPEFRDRLAALYEPDIIFSAIATENYAPLGEPGLWSARQPSEAPIHSDLSLLLSTSGSTGSPKFVRLSEKNVRSNADSIRRALGIEANDRAIASLPLNYSYGLSVLNSHLAAGASLVLTNEALTARPFWDLVREQECTSMAGVPYSYQILRRLDLEGLRVPRLQTLTQAGGKLTTDLISHFHQIMARRNGRFFVMYGQTEATARISILPAEKLPEKLGSVGPAIPNGSLSIEDGEVIYRGPNVMLGYAQERKDLALGDELGGRLATGDLGYLDADGFLFHTGRAKRDMKLFGIRINLDEVEALLRAHGPTAVVKNGEKLVAYCEQGDAETLTNLRNELAVKLSVHRTALDFRHIANIPVTPNGKIDYRQLEQL
ncbi:MAG TPA: AMP-binding protein [Bryobacteraceae bacterium]|nr:AMP-binding protein [Bryobacteraceae bacterium]